MTNVTSQKGAKSAGITGMSHCAWSGSPLSPPGFQPHPGSPRQPTTMAGLALSLEASTTQELERKQKLWTWGTRPLGRGWCSSAIHTGVGHAESIPHPHCFCISCGLQAHTAGVTLCNREPASDPHTPGSQRRTPTRQGASVGPPHAREPASDPHTPGSLQHGFQCSGSLRVPLSALPTVKTAWGCHRGSSVMLGLGIGTTQLFWGTMALKDTFP
ncbi:PREDICTED: uncharacterized protein LOC108516537 [Rhinopithecus bieti]|uniref:uncharacterized protein LOC108516537 n=1 Tax=Rhinopithecus bieti TaxID=61621 RepID=UPI00083BDFD6|nr:PREDICTED: uncharacterized protein LOC108516537 [Rhinopithecus bieti]